MAEEILVTGARGFVGRHVVARLRAGGHGVREWSHQQGEIARSALPLDGIRHVIHLAAKTFVPASWENPLEFYEVNVLGTANVLEHCRRSGARVTLVSSYIYGSPRALPIAEDHPLAPSNPYAESKFLSEEVARSYERLFGVGLTIVRPFNLYGPGQEARFLIPALVRQALDPEVQEIVVTDARPRRDFLYITDFAELIGRVVEREAGGVFNAGSGASVSVAEIAAAVNVATGGNKPLKSLQQHRPGELLDVYADISKADRLLAWTPRMALQEGLREIVGQWN